VFRSRSGKFLDRGYVRRLVRRAAAEAGVSGNVSAHWLRHSHASHAIDHGAPLSLIQATLGHASISTTSAYLHARPGDSSARYLALERLSPESARTALPLKHTGVMDVSAAQAAKGDSTMKTKTEVQAETSETVTAQEPKATKTAKVGA